MNLCFNEMIFFWIMTKDREVDIYSRGCYLETGNYHSLSSVLHAHSSLGSISVTDPFGRAWRELWETLCFSSVWHPSCRSGPFLAVMVCDKLGDKGFCKWTWNASSEYFMLGLGDWKEHSTGFKVYTLHVWLTPFGAPTPHGKCGTQPWNFLSSFGSPWALALTPGLVGVD